MKKPKYPPKVRLSSVQIALSFRKTIFGVLLQSYMIIITNITIKEALVIELTYSYSIEKLLSFLRYRYYIYRRTVKIYMRI